MCVDYVPCNSEPIVCYDIPWYIYDVVLCVILLLCACYLLMSMVDTLSSMTCVIVAYTSRLFIVNPAYYLLIYVKLCAVMCNTYHINIFCVGCCSSISTS